MKKNLLFSILILLLAIASITITTIAWFTPSSQYIDNIVVNTGTIDTQSILYYIEDFDHNGTTDKVDGEEVYTTKTDITINSMKAGEIYKYRLDIKNTGDINGELNVYFANATENLKDVLTFSSVIKDYNGNEILGAGTEEKSFADNTNFCHIDNFVTIDKLEEEPLPDYQISIYFEIAFKTLEELKILNPTIFSEKENLNEYQNITFNISQIEINLSQIV